MHLSRSFPVCHMNLPGWKRQQRNSLTSFIDASLVYGNHNEDASVLRKLEGGLLKWNRATGQLPTRIDVGYMEDPDMKRRRARLPTDFVAGDFRVNEQPLLTSFHTIWLREHNRIAREIERRLPKNLRTDEVIFQESRRLVAAELQNIVYTEWLPLLLGDKMMRDKDLLLSNHKTTYDHNTNPSVINSFSGAAMRFGHSMLRSFVRLVDKLNRLTFWRLRDTFDGQANHPRGPSGDTPTALPITPIMAGMLDEPADKVDEYVSRDLTTYVYQRVDLHEDFGLDLMALNIQRGRDHGLPAYKDFRTLAGLRTSL